MNLRYFVLLQNHYFVITTRYYIVNTVLCHDYCYIITLLLNFTFHYFKLLPGHYYIITTNYCRFTTNYFFIITSLLFDYYIGPWYYCIITTYLLLPHYYKITTSLLHHYYSITTIDCFHYYMVQFEIHYFMITSITPITTVFHYYITNHYYHYYHYFPP